MKMGRKIKYEHEKMEEVRRLFNCFANESSGIIEPEGFESFCSLLRMDHTDTRLFLLVWKMRAERQGYITLDEWRRGFKILGVDTLYKLKKALTGLQKNIVRKPSIFLDFYIFSFRYCLEEKRKSVDMESIIVLIDVVLGCRFRGHADSIIKYLKTQDDYKVINMDQWTGIYRFCSEVNFPDLDNYDPFQAWPLIMDNYVDWYREEMSK